MNTKLLFLRQRDKIAQIDTKLTSLKLHITKHKECQKKEVSNVKETILLRHINRSGKCGVNLFQRTTNVLKQKLSLNKLTLKGGWIEMLANSSKMLN